MFNGRMKVNGITCFFKLKDTKKNRTKLLEMGSYLNNNKINITDILLFKKDLTKKEIKILKK